MANPFYTLSPRSLDELTQQLNLILANISDRLDAIEGKRGSAEIASDLTLTGQLLVHDATGAVVGGFVDTTTGI